MFPPPPGGFFPPFGGGGPPQSFPPSSGPPPKTGFSGGNMGGPPRDFPDRRQWGKDFYKTRLCFSFEKGQCTAGDNCKYAHGQVELRGPGQGPGPGPADGNNRRFGGDEPMDFMDEQRPHSTPRERGRSGFQDAAQQPFDDRGNMSREKQRPSKKTQLCMQFENTGQCTYGDRCIYSHGVEEQRREIAAEQQRKEFNNARHVAGSGAIMGPGGPNMGSSFHGPIRGPGPNIGRGPAPGGGDTVGPIRGPGVGLAPGGGRGPNAGPGPGSMGGPGMGPGQGLLNRAGPGGPPLEPQPPHGDAFRPGPGRMPGARPGMPGKMGVGPGQPPGMGPLGGPPLPMPPSHQGSIPAPAPPPLPPVQAGGMPGPPMPAKGADVTFVDRVRAVCALLNIGNSQAASKEKPHAIQAAVAAIHNGSVFRENPFADNVEQFL